MLRSRFILLGPLALALAGGGTALGVGAAVAAPAPPPRASLTGFVCQTALDPATRGIAVTAVMRPVPSTDHMQVKFDLIVTGRRGHPFRLAKQKKSSSFGKWISPANQTLGQLPADVWKPIGQAANLFAPAYYRLRASFRWLGAGDAKLAQSTRTSATCFQPELRPVLVVRSISIVSLPAVPGEDAYDAVIANRGVTAAGAFDARLSEGQTVVGSATVPGLAPHRTHRVRLDGPACTAGELITVAADPAHLIDVASRMNSSLTIACPTVVAKGRRYT
ncbi:MAG: hypothetical protein M3076_08985 [Actinomycetota bacterium]|nr:hypothetical protein [Actinomycetota bacterium]